MASISAQQLKTCKTWLDLITSILTIFGSLAAGTYALIQYNDSSNAERAKETLKFIERFGKDELHSSKLNLNKSVDEILPELREKLKKGEKEYADFLLENIKQRKLDYDIGEISDFYDQIYVCSESSLCDADISLKFFGKYAYNLVSVLHPYILNEQNTKDSQFGSALLFFSKKHKERAIKDKGKTNWLSNLLCD